MTSLNDVFGNRGGGDKLPWLNPPKEEGESLTALFTGKYRWVPQYNQKTRKPIVMVKVKDEVTGEAKWKQYDKGPDFSEYETFEPEDLVTTVRPLDSEGTVGELHDLKWNYKGAKDALKAEMAEKGLGLDENVAFKLTLTSRQTKPFTFDVEMKEI